MTGQLISLAGLLRRPLHDPEGTQIGRIDDITVRWTSGTAYPPVTGVVTTVAILAGGIQTMYAAVNDRIRAMTAERLSRLTDASGELTTETALPGAARERLGEIDAQLPSLLHRHRMPHNALLLTYMTLLIVVLATVLIAVSITVPTAAAGDVALGLVLSSTVAVLLGLTFVAASVRHSANAVDYEVQPVLRLGS